MNKQQVTSEEKLKAAFNAFDQDGNGQISALELKQMLQDNGSNVSEDVWTNIIKEVDQNGDGLVNLLRQVLGELICNALHLCSLHLQFLRNGVQALLVFIADAKLT